MSAQDVIEQIKTLPPDELAKVLSFLQQMDTTATLQEGPAAPDFRSAAQSVFQRHAELMKRLSQ